MFAPSILLPLFAVTSVLASGSSDDSDPSIQKVLKSPPQCNAIGVSSTACPGCKCLDWCTHCPGRCPTQFVANTFDIFSVIFGIDFPANIKLCPVGKCEQGCICREDMVKRLSTVLLYDGKYNHDEKEEL